MIEGNDGKTASHRFHDDRSLRITKAGENQGVGLGEQFRHLRPGDLADEFHGASPIPVVALPLPFTAARTIAGGDEAHVLILNFPHRLQHQGKPLARLARPPQSMESVPGSCWVCDGLVSQLS